MLAMMPRWGTVPRMPAGCQSSPIVRDIQSVVAQRFSRDSMPLFSRIANVHPSRGRISSRLVPAEPPPTGLHLHPNGIQRPPHGTPPNQRTPPAHSQPPYKPANSISTTCRNKNLKHCDLIRQCKCVYAGVTITAGLRPPSGWTTPYRVPAL